MKKSIKGNLVTLAEDGEFDIIIHGQNCFHSWGKGIVKEIARTFPAAKRADLDTSYGKKKKLGSYSHAVIPLKSGKELIVINAYTQFDFGQKKVHLNYRALEEVFIKIAQNFPDKTIAYPKIGAGRAGGDWKKISAIIDEQLKDFEHTLVVL